jgi:putative flavoprotein involved in K+ transport
MGEVLHDGGVTPSPGLYVLGLNFLRRRRSHFIGGVGLDAEDLAPHIDCYVSRSHRAAA